MAVDWTMDLAFIGAPLDPVSHARWSLEISLLKAAGLRVLVAHRPEDIPPDATFPRAFIAGTEGLALKGLAPGAEVILRRAGPQTASLAARLCDQLQRRVTIAPLDPAERARLLTEMPAHWLTSADFPPLLSGEPLAAALLRPLDLPWRISLDPDLAACLPLASLRRDLLAMGLARESIAIGPDPRPHLRLALQIPPADDLAAALEAGTLVVLPPAAKPEAEPWAPVLRWSLADLPGQILALAAAKPWRDASLALGAKAKAHWGDAAFIARMRGPVAGLAPSPGDPAPRRIIADLALIGDFRRPDEVNTRALIEARALAEAGTKLLLVQVWNGKEGGKIHPGFDGLLRAGLAEVLAPCDLAEVETAQVLIPRLTIPALTLMRPALRARRWVVTETEAQTPDWDAARLHAELYRLYGAVAQWAASDRAARRILAQALPVPVAAWPDVTCAKPKRLRAPPSLDPRPVAPVLGLMAYDPADAAPLVASLAGQGALYVLLAGHRRSLPGQVPAGVTVLGLEGLDLVHFVNRIDALVVPPGLPFDRLPRMAVTLALARGLRVLAPPELAPLLGQGVTYAHPSLWPQLLARLKPHPLSLARPEAPACADLLGLPTRPAPKRQKSKRVLFVTANGVGLGHVTRLSAIARRLPPEVEPIFATMSQAASVLQDMGYFCELLTGYSGRPAEAWRASLRERILNIVDHHRPAVVVLDSSNPYPGVLEALVSRPEIALVWVRRGMWRDTQDNAEFLTRAPCFDRIIEPQDIAEAPDPAPFRSPRVVKVPPIGLLDEEDLLPREAARAALGLPADAGAGSVLVQLGSGTTRDLDRLLDETLDQLSAVPGLEIVLAQWLNTASSYDARWPGVRILSGYPIPRYYRAFDFTISAAGYNSFNDLLRFGLPTIFVANDAPNMDDQGARSRHAEAAEAAFDIPENDLSTLPDCIAAMLQPEVRAYLQERARALALPNGAEAAARAILEVLR